MSTIEAQRIVGQYAEKLRKAKYSFSAIYLFGSYAKGIPRYESDIDVAVVSKEIEKGWKKGKMRLWNLTAGVDSRIEPHGFSPKEFQEDWRPMVHEIKTTGIKVQ